MTGTSSADWHVGAIVAPLSAPDHAAAIRLLTVLRPALEPDEAGVFLTEAMSSGYEIALSRPAGTDTDPIGLAGFRVLPTSRGRILLLEDFVVEEASRGSGAGAVLFEAVRATARECGCVRLELDTARTNVSAQRFYHRHGMNDSALHFGIDLA